MEARRAHNPEVVGSSPASATIKTPDFTTKSGVFLTFGDKMENPKIPMGLAVGLVLTLLKVHKGKNPTLLGKFVFLHFRRFLNRFQDRFTRGHRSQHPKNMKASYGMVLFYHPRWGK